MIETASREHIDPDSLASADRIDLLRSYAFTGVHILALGTLFTGVSVPALIALLVTFRVRLFGITGGYHRYVAHRSFKTSRFFQFALARLGASAGQNGPLWWVSHHRLHHRHADTDHDAHSPGLKGFWWAHAQQLVDGAADARRGVAQQPSPIPVVGAAPYREGPGAASAPSCPMSDARPEPDFPRPVLVLSQCLELEPCRYNGKRIPFDLVRHLEPWVEFRPVCPEIEVGLGVAGRAVRGRLHPGPGVVRAVPRGACE